MARFRRREAQLRGPGKRLALTLAALASLIVGYYLGQWWQRPGLDGLSAIVYQNGHVIDYPPALQPGDADGEAAMWRLFVVADTDATACATLRDRYALVINRLAQRRDIQDRVRVTLLAYNAPNQGKVDEFIRGLTWLDIVGADQASLDALSAQLGIQPSGAWCSRSQANAVLVAPDATAWALIPYEQAAIMAHDIITIIDFVE